MRELVVAHDASAVMALLCEYLGALGEVELLTQLAFEVYTE